MTSPQATPAPVCGVPQDYQTFALFCQCGVTSGEYHAVAHGSEAAAGYDPDRGLSCVHGVCWKHTYVL